MKKNNRILKEKKSTLMSIYVTILLWKFKTVAEQNEIRRVGVYLMIYLQGVMPVYEYLCRAWLRKEGPHCIVQ